MKSIRLIDLKGQTFNITIDGKITIELIHQKLLNDYNYSHSNHRYFCRSGKILDSKCLQNEIFDEKTLNNPIIIFNYLHFPDKSYPKVDNSYNFHFSRYSDNFINNNTPNSQLQNSNTRYQSPYDRLLDMMGQEYPSPEEFRSIISNFDQYVNQIQADINLSDSDSDNDDQTERPNDQDGQNSSIYTTPSDTLDMAPNEWIDLRYDNNDDFYFGSGLSMYGSPITTETDFGHNDEDTSRMGIIYNLFHMGIDRLLETTRIDGNQDDQQNAQDEQPDRAQGDDQDDQQNNEINQRREMPDIFSVGAINLLLGNTRIDANQGDQQNAHDEQPGRAQGNDQDTQTNARANQNAENNEIQNNQNQQENRHVLPSPNPNHIPLFNLRNDQSILNQQIIESLNLNVTLDEADSQAISRLVQIGYDRATVIQIYYACDKDEETAMG